MKLTKEQIEHIRRIGNIVGLDELCDMALASLDKRTYAQGLDDAAKWVEDHCAYVENRNVVVNGIRALKGTK